MKTIFIWILGAVVFFGSIWALTAFQYGSYKFWAPKFEDAKREVFENTKSFRDGSARDLDNLRLEYLRAKTPEEKAALKDVMRHRALGVPAAQISPETRAILNNGE